MIHCFHGVSQARGRHNNKKESPMTDTHAERGWLTMAQYAEAKAVSPSTVKRWKLQGLIPFRQVGRIVRIPRQALDFDWLQRWRDQRPTPE